MHVRGSGSRGNLVQTFAATGEGRGGRSELAIVSAWRQGFGGAGLRAERERERDYRVMVEIDEKEESEL
jgi:hypothetical protein